MSDLSAKELGVLRWVSDLPEPASIELSISALEDAAFTVLPNISDANSTSRCGFSLAVT